MTRPVHTYTQRFERIHDAEPVDIRVNFLGGPVPSHFFTSEAVDLLAAARDALKAAGASERHVNSVRRALASARAAHRAAVKLEA